MSQYYAPDQKQLSNNNNIVNMPSANSPPAGTHIIHVRDDSNSQMEALFSVLDNPRPISSLKNRNFPTSFFNPPDPKHGRHSRDSSLDCTLSAAAPLRSVAGDVWNSGGGTPQAGGGQVGGLKIMHGRSASSPAQFPQTMSLAPQQQLQEQQISEVKCDPNAMEIGNMGNKNTRALSINGGTADVWAAQRQQQQHSKNKVAVVGPRVHTVGANRSQPQQELGPLPEGWDQGVTPEGEVYYINHINKTTTWFDPRMPESAQRALHAQKQKQQLLQQQQKQHQQLQQQQAAVQGFTDQEYLKSELLRLRQENEKLRREMEKVTQHELALNQLLSQGAGGLGGVKAPLGNIGGAGLSGSVVGVDAFLGQMPVKQEYHARQSSNDSGLGGMSNQGYSLPRTPDDCLSAVDDMDILDSGRSMKKLTLSGGTAQQQGGGPLLFNSCDGQLLVGLQQQTVVGGGLLPGSASVITVNQMDLSDGIGGNLYGEEHVSSLAEGGICMQMLSDMDAQKIDSMQWL